MTHTYQLTGMTCNGCVAKVKSQLLMNPDILSAEVTLNPQQAVITMQKHVSVKELQKAIGTDKYIITEDANDLSHHAMEAESVTSWIVTHKPLLLIFVFITGITIISSFQDGHLDTLHWMNRFMAGFFIVFSFFKLLNLNGFADSYAMYDLLAKRIKTYGYIYPFIELTLGLAYLTGFNPVFTNIATIVVMGFSSIGVIQSVLNKKQIQCACLGDVFKLPMSTVTIIEDLLMVAMAGIALIQIY